MNKAKLIIIILSVAGAAHGGIEHHFHSSGEINNGDNWGTVYVHNNNTVVDMWGGYVEDLITEDSSTVNIYGGQITGGDGYGLEKGIGVWFSSTVNVRGGEICAINTSQSGTLNLFGGDIEVLTGNGIDGTINIYGTSLSITGNGGVYDGGIVSGAWSDGTVFSIDMYGAYSLIQLHEIPEPCTIILLGLGGLFVRNT